MSMIAPARWMMGAAAKTAGLSSRRRRSRSGNGQSSQEATLRKLVGAYADTEYGRRHGLQGNETYGAYALTLPTRTYEGFAPWVSRTVEGEADILWPGVCDYFAVSSGTTVGRTKHLPITKEMIGHFRKAGLESLLYFSTRSGGQDVFYGRHLFLGGSTTLDPVKRAAGKTPALQGDLSGITALNLPAWAETLLYEPGKNIAQIGDWNKKIEAIAERTWHRDISLLAGIPSWILILAEQLKKKAAQEGVVVDTLRALWPNLRCLVHGGVPITPYREELQQMLGEEVLFHEVYPASEGFIAAQDAEPEAGLRLLTDVGIFYEFAPLAAFDEEHPESLGSVAVPLEGVRTGEDYVLIMSTPAGLSRYIIGDVVRFTSTEVPRLVYAGRTKLQLSAFGEHVIEKELTDVLCEAALREGLRVADFHVAPIFVDTQRAVKRGSHEWWIALREEPAAPDLAKRLSRFLDQELRRRNDDYDAKRAGGGLTEPEIRLVSPQLFEQWKRESGRWGGQNKMPRCRSDRDIADKLERIRLSRQNS